MSRCPLSTHSAYYEDKEGHTLSDKLRDALTYLMKTMEVASGMIVQLRCAQPRPVVIYTDASAEDPKKFWTPCMRRALDGENTIPNISARRCNILLASLAVKRKSSRQLSSK
eukprot:4920393-Amphidinium_carterae.1